MKKNTHNRAVMTSARPTAAGQLDERVRRLGLACGWALALSAGAMAYAAATGPWAWDGWPRLLSVWAFALAGFLLWRRWAALAERWDRFGW